MDKKHWLVFTAFFTVMVLAAIFLLYGISIAESWRQWHNMDYPGGFAVFLSDQKPDGWGDIRIVMLRAAIDVVVIWIASFLAFRITKKIK